MCRLFWKIKLLPSSPRVWYPGVCKSSALASFILHKKFDTGAPVIDRGQNIGRGRGTTFWPGPGYCFRPGPGICGFFHQWMNCVQKSFNQNFSLKPLRPVNFSRGWGYEIRLGPGPRSITKGHRQLRKSVRVWITVSSERWRWDRILILVCVSLIVFSFEVLSHGRMVLWYYCDSCALIS